MNFELLDKYGIDTTAGLKRCMSDSGLYEKVLLYFLDDNLLERAEAAYGNGDLEELFECMHELKGSCGNAALTELYAAVCDIVEMLRPGNKSNLDAFGLERSLERVKGAYHKAREGISAARDV